MNTVLAGVAMISLSGLFMYSNSVNEKLVETQLKVNLLETTKLNMRRAEKDFLLYKDASYVTEFNNGMSKFKELNQSLINREEDPTVKGNLDRLDFLMNGYAKAFNDLSNQQKMIGLNYESGLYGQLRDAVHKAESEIKGVDDKELMVLMLQMRRAEKDFMLRYDIKYMESFEKAWGDYSEKLKSSDLASAELREVSENYHKTFVNLVQNMKTLGLNDNEGMLDAMLDLVLETNDLFKTIEDKIENNLSSEKEKYNSIILTSGSIIVVLLALLSIMLGRSISRPISRVNEVVNRIREENDLSLRINLLGDDEMVHLGKNLDVMLEGFSELIGDVKKTVVALNKEGSNLFKNVKISTDGANKQLQETDQVATASTEMGSTIEEIARNTEGAASNAQATNKKAGQGLVAVEATVSQISMLAKNLDDASSEVLKLDQESKTISSVLDVIKGIADQTNLLALNAAIEAARAGDQGRGFAVVADEVRTLAIRTQKSTEEIAVIIGSLQKQTGSIVEIMTTCSQQGNNSAEQASKAGDLLREITSDVASIMDMSTQIAAAIEEQSLVANEVNRNVNNIRDIAEESSLMASENQKSSQNLSEQANILNKAVEKYKV